MKKIYVGNLPYTATEAQVRELFERHGDVSSVALVTESGTGHSLGFGFVEMEDGGMADALEDLNGHNMDGRTLKVIEAPDNLRGSGRNKDDDDNSGC